MHLPDERLCYNLFMLMLKIVPEQKMARFYEVHVQSTLTGQSCRGVHLGKYQEWLSSGANDQNAINR